MSYEFAFQTLDIIQTVPQAHHNLAQPIIALNSKLKKAPLGVPAIEQVRQLYSPSASDMHFVRDMSFGRDMRFSR